MPLPPPLQQCDRTYMRWRGRKLSYFAGCDYFRLASHPKVLAAARSALGKYGLNVAASRQTTGNHSLYVELEAALAGFFGAPAATLASNGYLPNLMVAQALAGQFSHALLDERAHGSLADAAQLLECPVVKFKHRDPADLARTLARLGRVKPLLLTDGVFSHDGGIAPLRDYLGELPADGMILLDDAHGAGVLGATGRGTLEYFRIGRNRVIQTVTLSKAFGVYGGAVLGSRRLREQIIARSRLFTGNTPLPLPLAHAARVSIGLLKGNRALRQRLARNVDMVKAGLRSCGLSLHDNPSPIVAVIPRDAKHAADLRKALLAAGIHPPFIKYPGGPEGGYFRFVISSEHSRPQLDALVRVLRTATGA